MASAEVVPNSTATHLGSQSAFSRWSIGVVLLVIILAGLVRLRLAEMPLERDEGEYAYAGQLMLQGIPPYQLAYNMKLPGTYAAYAVLMSFLGQTPRGIHLGLILISSLTILLVYFLGCRISGTLTGTVAAVSYALLSTHPSTLGFAAHATHFVVLCALAGLLLLLRAQERRSSVTFFGSGLFVGLAFLMKQPGLFFGLFAFVYLTWQLWRGPKSERLNHVTRGAALLAGLVTPFGLTCVLLWRAGVFGNFWFWTFSYARQYSSLVSFKDGWTLFAYNFVPIFKAVPGIWILALAGLITLALRWKSKPDPIFPAGLFVFSALAVSSGLYFRSHYFILILPVIGLLAGIAIAAFSELLRNRGSLRVIPGFVFAVICLLGIYRNAPYYLRFSPLEACREIYVNSPFPEALVLGDYLRQNTTQADRIMVLGSEPEVYFYSHRHSASGYIYMYGLMENQPYWQTMQKQMIQEIESNQPVYLLYFNHPASWLTTMGSSRMGPFLEWANAYVKDHYDQVGRVEIPPPGDRENGRFVWGDAARTTPSQSTYQITIFRRKG